MVLTIDLANKPAGPEKATMKMSFDCIGDGARKQAAPPITPDPRKAMLRSRTGGETRFPVPRDASKGPSRLEEKLYVKYSWKGFPIRTRSGIRISEITFETLLAEPSFDHPQPPEHPPRSGWPNAQKSEKLVTESKIV